MRINGGDMESTKKIRMISPADVAEMLDVSVHTLRGWRNADSGPPWYKIEGSVRYSLDDLLEWIERNTADGTQGIAASKSAGDDRRGPAPRQGGRSVNTGD